MDRSSRIFVAGHRGLVGSALVRRLEAKGFRNILTRKHSELDLENPALVQDFFAGEAPRFVFLAAAKVGGIHSNNTYPVDFLLRNLKIQTNIIEAAWRSGVDGLLFLGSSCIYPKMAPQPLREEYLLTGPLEPTNEPYGIAKIAGIELCEAFNRQYGTRFLSVMPTNLYGPNDNYDLENSHVLPALLRKFHLGKLAERGEWTEIVRNEAVLGPIPEDFARNLAAISKFHGHTVPAGGRFGGGNLVPSPAIRLWGTGSPKREFLYVDDLADACVLLMERLDEVIDALSANPKVHETAPASVGSGEVSSAAKALINIGSGKDLTIRELAEEVSRTIGFDGPIEWDASRPDGTPRKFLEGSKLRAMGWAPEIVLTEGVRMAYRDYLSRISRQRD